MIAGLYRLSHSDIADLKMTIEKITTCNSTYQQLKNSDIWIECEDPTQVFQAEIQKKFKIVNNLSGITLSVLDDTSRLLQQRQELKSKSEELLQGLHFLQLDYYELREQNQKLKEVLIDSHGRLQNFIHQRDLAFKRHEQICQELTKNNQYLERQLKNLELQKLQESSPPSEMIPSVFSKNCNYLEQQILDLRVEVYDLRKMCQDFSSQNEHLEQQLKAAKAKIIDLEIQADAKRQIQYNGQKMVFRKYSNSFHEKDSDSFHDIVKSNLKTEIESIPNILLNDKYSKQPNPIFNISNQSSFNSSHRSRLLPQVPQIWIAESEKSASKSQLSPSEALEEKSGSQSRQSSLIKQTSFGHELQEVESEEKNSSEKSMIKTQLVNTQLNKQTKQSLREDKNQPYCYQSIKQRVDPEPEIQRGSKMLKRAKSFSKIAHPLIKSESQNNLRLYSKYRGELQSKYPNLKQFKNKVLQKKMQIIEECVAKKTSGFQRKNYEKLKKDHQIKIQKDAGKSN